MSTYKLDVPRLIAAEHGIENREQFSHASGDGDFFKFASGDQSLMKTANDRVRADSRERSHIQNTTNIRTSGLDVASPPIESGIAIERSNTNQSGYLMAVELTQLRQARQHRMGGRRSNAFTAAKQIIFVPPGRTGTDLVIEIFFQLCDVLLQPLNVFLNQRPHRRGRTMKSILLGRQHPDKLPSTRADGFQLLGRLIGHRAQFGTNLFTECLQDVGIDSVALRQSTDRPSEVSRLTWIDGDRRQACGDETAKNETMIRAGRLQDDERWRYGIQRFNDFVDAFIIVTELHLLIARTD